MPTHAMFSIYLITLNLSDLSTDGEVRSESLAPKSLPLGIGLRQYLVIPP